MSDKRKQLLSYQALIDKMVANGILFNIFDQNTAKNILQTRNYYYKISSYRKLFNKVDGKYNIEFATLADLAVIDMQIRYFLMDVITKNPKVDGYDIVKDYAVYNPIGFTNTKNALSNNHYLKNVYIKHKNDIPIWVLIEVMDFGNLCYLVEMYCDKYPSNKRLKKAKQLGKYARHIRNACAHSNVILVDVLEQTLSPSSSITSLASMLNISRDIIKYRKIHDIFSLVVLHREYCSKALGKQRFKEFIKIAKRTKKHEDYYKQNTKIIEMYKNFVKTLVKISKK